MTLPNQDPNGRQLSDEIDWENYGMKLIKGGLDSAQKEAGAFIDKQAKDVFGNNQSSNGGGVRPIQESYEAMNQQQQAKQPNEMVEKAKGINPLIYGAIGMGIGKLAGLGWVTSAGIGIGTAGGKYLLIDKKQ